jgi:enediyne biosynthesis protein E4
MIRPLLLCFAALPAAAQDIPRFADETVSAGIAHSFAGEWEFMVGGGAAIFDCNADGRKDVYLAGGVNPAALFINQSETGGALAFTPAPSGADLDMVTGAYPINIDGDGIPDMVVLRVGENVVMRGLGNCQFENANQALGFDGGDAWSTAFSAIWEGDNSLPTLAIGNYIDRTQEAFPWGNCTDNWLHRPNGNRYAAPLPLTPSYCALSILFTDWNRSGKPSLRVSNDREYYKGGQEQLWHMEETPRQYTAEEGFPRLRIWGMGIANADITGDGLPDYYLTSMADQKFQTLADTKASPLVPNYTDTAFAKGITAHRPYTGGDLRPSTGWHAQFADVNNDGLDDLFVAKGNVWAMPDFAALDPNNLFLQTVAEDGAIKFTEGGDVAGVASMNAGRGGGVADFNGDGWLDLLVVNRNSPVEIWRNTGAADGAALTGGYVTVKLSQPAPNTDAIGAWIELRVGDVLRHREVTIGGGHVSGILGPHHFGLGDAEQAEVRVLWPDGTASDWVSVAAGGAVTLAR